MLKPWQIQFINKLKAGDTEATALESLRVSRSTYEKEYEENEEFQNAIALSKSGYSGTQLDVSSLRGVLEAQVNDEMAAAYFGMKTSSFIETVKADPELKLAYETGRDGGKARMLMAAYATGLDGDSAMQKHFLAFHNNMVEKQAVQPALQINIVSTIEEAAQKLAFLNQASSIIASQSSNVIDASSNIIDAEYAEVESECQIEESCNEEIIDSESEIMDNGDTNLNKGDLIND